ncbi:MAG: hypothetical protein JW966_11130 [Anaerolineae bacterium]|nr:hypothetical protein [Anaerolineae bacterium]
MRRLLFVLIGLVCLAGGAVTLWLARGPQPTEERTTGGVLTTQAEIEAQGEFQPGQEPSLEVITDDGFGSTTSIGAAPQIAAAALADVSEMDAAETEAQPAMIAEVAEPGDVTLTTDVVLDENTDTEVTPLVLAEPQPIDADGQGGPLLTATYEQRVVELEWPKTFRVGGSGSVRIKLKMLADGSLQPVAEIDTNQVLATPILITDRYDTHDATVTASLSAPDFDVTNVSQATQPLQRGGEVEWRWTLKADDAATSVIALGLSITWIPREAGAPYAPSNVTIWGQTVQVKSEHVFGLITVPQASIAGTVLAVVGFVGQLPLLEVFLETFWNVFFKRRSRRREKQRRNQRRR